MVLLQQWMLQQHWICMDWTSRLSRIARAAGPWLFKLFAVHNSFHFFFCIISRDCIFFIDAFGRFRYFEVSWPGATGDITAYKQTMLYRWFCDKMIPPQYHQVLDEAYCSIGGDQHLTPYTRAQLRKAYRDDYQLYLQMKAFNVLLSSERITIERGIYII